MPKMRPEYHREWFKKNRLKRIEQIRKSFQKKLAYIRAYLADHPCVDCSEPDPIVLDFDHVRGTKLGNVGYLARKGWSYKRLDEEIAKCEVRCANCHRRKTAKDLGWFKFTPCNLAD